ncbi:MAG: cadherin-like domain-containing protein, partial [Verrucomicrobiota bacterium]
MNTSADTARSGLQQSGDLRTWTTIETIEGANVSAQFDRPAGAQPEFFRMIKLAAPVPPMLVNNTLTIQQGQAVEISSDFLNATDSDTPPDQLTFTVSNIANGQFERVSAIGTAITEFTQAEVNAGQIRFIHDGSNNAPAWEISVSDGVLSTNPIAGTIVFNQPGGGGGGDGPMLVANSLNLIRGQTVTLSVSHLNATDPNSPAGSLTHTVSGVSRGRFERAAAGGTAITEFTQAEVNAGEIRFVHDNSMMAPAFSVRVSDGVSVSPALPANINFSMMGHMTPGAEFQNALKLATDAQATHTAVKSGSWSDATVWGGSLPGGGSRVVIPQGISVTVDSVLTPEHETVRIDGTLRFATHADSQLKVDTLISTHAGMLEMGTSSIPVAKAVTARVIFADDVAIDPEVDTAQMGRGAILHGQTTIYGDATTNKVKLAVHPAAGAQQIQLANVPIGWDVGDEIVITGTIVNDPRSDEVRTITAIDGTNVTLNAALSRNHIAPDPTLNVWVANLTRNVIFSSENATTNRRGHIMFMHTLDVDVNYARFRQLGRTDKTRELDDFSFTFNDELIGNTNGAPVHFTVDIGDRTNIRGRYSIHLHRGGTDPSLTPALINGCVVDDGPGWGYVNHSANAIFRNNVSYDIRGVGYYTEVGDETGSMIGNIAIRTWNPTFRLDSEGGAIDPDLGFDHQDFGNDGDGYWLTGNRVAMIDNVSAGASAHGIIYWVDGQVEADIPRGRATVKVSELGNGHLIPGRDEIPVWWAPLAECRGNESYGATIGFRARYIHSRVYMGEGGSAFHESPPQAYIDTLEPTIDAVTVWNARDGMILNYNERLSVKNSRLVGIGAPYFQDGGTADTGVGLDNGNEVTNGPGRLENLIIEGYEMGIIACRSDQWSYKNLTLKNVTDMMIQQPRLGPRTLTMENITFGSLAGTAVAGRGGRRNIFLPDAEFDEGSFQPYFFLLPDRITLEGQGIYYPQQAANFTPLRSQPDESILQIPSGYLNKTNQQLQTTYGLSFGGFLTPGSATSDSRISNGSVGPAPPVPVSFPPLFDMTGEGFSPEQPNGGPTPELTGLRLKLQQGE